MLNLCNWNKPIQRCRILDIASFTGSSKRKATLGYAIAAAKNFDL
jgi:hypothetical protein